MNTFLQVKKSILDSEHQATILLVLNRGEVHVAGFSAKTKVGRLGNLFLSGVFYFLSPGSVSWTLEELLHRGFIY